MDPAVDTATDPKRAALVLLRVTAERFAKRWVSYDEWMETGHRLMTDFLLDDHDLDRAVADLPADIKPESTFYIEWLFAAGRDEFKNRNWVYGCPEPDGWIDKELYQRKFAEAFRRLDLSPIRLTP